MASDLRTAEFIAEQIAAAGSISYRKMFGEYALYVDDKVVAFICDDQLFVKPTEPGRAFIGAPDEAPAYPGSKLYFRIPEDHWDDAEWLSSLMRTTVAALPAPKPKRKRNPNR